MFSGETVGLLILKIVLLPVEGLTGGDQQSVKSNQEPVEREVLLLGHIPVDGFHFIAMRLKVSDQASDSSRYQKRPPHTGCLYQQNVLFRGLFHRLYPYPNHGVNLAKPN